jgi:hypothetical protein
VAFQLNYHRHSSTPAADCLLSQRSTGIYPETPKVPLTQQPRTKRTSHFSSRNPSTHIRSRAIGSDFRLHRDGGAFICLSLRLILGALHESGLLMQTSVHRTHTHTQAEHAIKCTNMLINLPCTRGVLTRSRLHRTAQQQQLQTARRE